MTGNAEGDIVAPRANAELFGHELAEARLLSAVESGRPAHAWLFAGPRGIGKATLAFRFARYLLSGGGQSGDADLFGARPQSLAIRSLAIAPGCDVFRHVAAGAHRDLLIVERAFDEKRNRLRSEIVVDDVRRVSGFLGLTAAEGGYRVVIVDSADDMNRNAANALLKSLEEPPAKAVLILVSHAPGRLLPTLRSRCRRLDLSPLADDQVLRVLSRIRPDIDPADLPGIVRLAAGSPGRAVEIAAAGGAAIYADLMRIVGGEGGDRAGFRAPEFDIPAAHAMAERLARRSEADTFTLFFDLARLWLARLVRYGAAGEGGREIVAGESDAMRQALQRRSLEHWAEVWEKVDRLAARADGLDLDRRQVVLGALLLLDPGHMAAGPAEGAW
ncbi:MAG: DNA polymerase III subunit delta' [Alphaproteobacteria bacterium]